MNIWLYKKNEYAETDKLTLLEEIEENDKVYIYSDDNDTGTFLLSNELSVDKDKKVINNESFVTKNIDLPYTILYKTKSEDSMTKLSNKEIEFILGLDINIDEEIDIRSLFAEYIEKLPIQTKKISKRIKYLDDILPNKIDEHNPISIFSIQSIDILNEIKNLLSSGNSLYEWDRKGSYAGEILQTVNMYIKFLEDMSDNLPTEKQTLNADEVELNNGFISFLKYITPKDDGDVELHDIDFNIQFNIGQPNTGKSYNFDKSRIFKDENEEHYKYLKIPVSGGIGNEYKGLQNTDLAITFDPINKELRFGEFLQMLMSAIVNPKVPHVVFLDDFHNQDISSLLSEYTPLFKAQQKDMVNTIDPSSPIYNNEFSDTSEFIKNWNTFIDTHCSTITNVPLTNRISGDSLKLIYPDNFYLLGAANFNENTLNIFADWEDRANITYKNPINTFDFELSETDAKIEENVEFLECCKLINSNLKQILKDKDIFDYDRYCFGMWKIVKADKSIINTPDERKNAIIFFFGMIKNSLKFNNKNSYINDIGWELIVLLQDNKWFKDNIIKLTNNTEVNCEILYDLNIYEDEI